MISGLFESTWRQVFGGTNDAIKLLLSHKCAESKIANLQSLIYIEQNVIGLEVSMNNAVYMAVTHTAY
jgi:hypothetical protein